MRIVIKKTISNVKRDHYITLMISHRTKVNGLVSLGMDTGFNSGPMVRHIWDFSKIITHMARVLFNIPTVINTLVTGRIIELMVLENALASMDLVTMVNGEIINNTATE